MSNNECRSSKFPSTFTMPSTFDIGHWTFDIRLSLPAHASQDELGEQPHPRAGGPFGDVGALAVRVGRARDVEVGPGKPVHELPQEPRRRNGAGGPAAAVLHVGELGLVLLAVFVPQR